MAAEIPDQIVLKRHRDLEGMRNWVWVRRTLLSLVTLFCALGLANVFGQRPQGTHARAAAADLEVYAPKHLRSGILYMARFTISAHRDLKDATIVLAPGWAESITINTIEPGPVSEGSRDGDILFKLGHVPSGQKFRLFMEFQVNPTNVGRRSQDVTLYDGATQIVHVERTVTVFP